MEYSTILIVELYHSMICIHVALHLSKDEVLLQCLEIWLLPQVNSPAVACIPRSVHSEPCKCLDHKDVPTIKSVTSSNLLYAHTLKFTSFGNKWSLFIRFFRSRFFGSIPFTAFHKICTCMIAKSMVVLLDWICVESMTSLI